MPIKSDSFFRTMIDELIEYSKYDPELANGIKWLDGYKGLGDISFYDKVFEVLYKHDIEIKAKNWLRNRN